MLGLIATTILKKKKKCLKKMRLCFVSSVIIVGPKFFLSLFLYKKCSTPDILAKINGTAEKYCQDNYKCNGVAEPEPLTSNSTACEYKFKCLDCPKYDACLKNPSEAGLP